jgi:hypothetical protein
VDDRVAELTSDEGTPQPGTHQENGKWIEETPDALASRIDRERKKWRKEHPDAKHGQGPYPYLTVVVVRRDGAQVPQTLVVEFEDGSLETRSWDDGRLWHRFSFRKPVKGKTAWLDADRRFLLDDNKLNDGRTRVSNRAPARRWASDVAAIVEVLLALVVTL